MHAAIKWTPMVFVVLAAAALIRGPRARRRRSGSHAAEPPTQLLGALEGSPLCGLPSTKRRDLLASTICE